MSTETRSTCPYCGVGCGGVIRNEGSPIVDARGDPEPPAKFGRPCANGSTPHLSAAPQVTAQARLRHPMRRDARGAAPVRIAGDGALDRVATRIADTVPAHGPDAVAA